MPISGIKSNVIVSKACFALNIHFCRSVSGPLGQDKQPRHPLSQAYSSQCQQDLPNETSGACSNLNIFTCFFSPNNLSFRLKCSNLLTSSPKKKQQQKTQHHIFSFFLFLYLFSLYHSFSHTFVCSSLSPVLVASPTSGKPKLFPSAVSRVLHFLSLKRQHTEGVRVTDKWPLLGSAV